MNTLGDVLDLIEVRVAIYGKADIVAYLDNDDVSFHEGETHLLSLHPHEVQVQALAALGIKTEPV